MIEDVKIQQQREYIKKYLLDTVNIVDLINIDDIIKISEKLQRIKRIFILGIGGSAANASHFVNDLRKISGLEAYAPTDNVAELTARVNDNGWETVFKDWLKGSHLSSEDGILVLSVGGGDSKKNISVNLVNAIDYAESVGATVLGIIGRDGGYTVKHADACIIVPTVNPDTITAHTEEVQAIILHLLVSHPAMNKYGTKWESTK